jgi:hypothetical protein
MSEYTHDDAMRHLRMLLRLCEDSVCQYCTEGSDRGDGSCMGTRSDWRNALEAYIENIETECNNWHGAQVMALGRCRELIEENERLANQPCRNDCPHYADFTEALLDPRYVRVPRGALEQTAHLRYGNTPARMRFAQELLREYGASAYVVPDRDEQTHAERMRDAESDMCGDDER